MLNLKTCKKHYPGFDLDLNLQIGNEQIIGIAGPNGSGKTTLIKAILELIRADDMDLTLFDSRIDRLSVQDKEQIGVVFSESGFCDILNLKQIRAILKNLYRSFDESFYNSLLQTFSLPENKPIVRFSSGQKNLVKLIAAITHQARLLILDEPTNGLDIAVRQKVLELLAQYSEERHAAILITSHISSDLETFCDELYLLRNGKVALHDRMDILLEEYGLIKTDQLPEDFDQEYLLYRQKTPYGYQFLTNQKQFYKENYPEIVIETPSLDTLELICYQGEKL